MYLGSDSSPEDCTSPRTFGKVQLVYMRRENSNNRLVVAGLSPHFLWDIDSLLEASTVDSPTVNGACLTDIKTEPGLRRRSKGLMDVMYKYIFE